LFFLLLNVNDFVFAGGCWVSCTVFD